MWIAGWGCQIDIGSWKSVCGCQKHIDEINWYYVDEKIDDEDSKIEIWIDEIDYTHNKWWTDRYWKLNLVMMPIIENWNLKVKNENNWNLKLKNEKTWKMKRLKTLSKAYFYALNWIAKWIARWLIYFQEIINLGIWLWILNDWMMVEFWMKIVRSISWYYNTEHKLNVSGDTFSWSHIN